jgi:hypothetical protein
MNVRQLTSAFAIAAMLAGGSAFAQATSPSTTPNDSGATPPNTSVPVGTPAPAATRSTTPGPVSTTPVSPANNQTEKGKAPSTMGNTNVSPTMGGGAPYDGKKN